MRAFLHQVNSLLTPKQRRDSIFISLLLSLQSLLDFFSLAFFLPLIVIILEPGIVKSNVILKTFHDLGGFTTPSSFVIAFTIAILLFMLLKTWIAALITKAKTNYSYAIAKSLSSRALDVFIQQDYTRYAKVEYAKALNRVMNYPIAFGNNILLSVMTLFSETLVCLLIVLCIAIFNFKSLFFLILILAPISLLFRIKRERIRTTRNTIEQKSPLTIKRVLAMIEGFTEIRAYGRASYFQKRIRESYHSLVDAFTKDHMTSTSITRLTELSAACVVCFIILYTVLSEQNYQQTIILLGLYASASFRVIPSINRILQSLQQLHTHGYLLHELEVGIPVVRSEANVHSSLTFEKNIEIKNVSFQYVDDAEKLLFKDLKLSIRKGEKIAITGKSGEGKSTLLLMLLGFIKPKTGEILVDQTPVNDPQMLHHFSGYVAQNPYILDGTIAENIAFGIPTAAIDSSRIEHLIEKLGLKTLIESLPEGIHTRIGEKGITLSGGQRQRVAIARALYINPDILVCDEVTNQLHASLEMEIFELLNQLASEHKTIIMVTHKIPATKFFDTVYTLRDGTLHKIESS